MPLFRQGQPEYTLWGQLEEKGDGAINNILRPLLLSRLLLLAPITSFGVEEFGGEYHDLKVTKSFPDKSYSRPLFSLIKINSP